MMCRVRLFTVALGALLFASGEVRAQTLRQDIESVVRDYLAEHPEDVQRIVKDYLVKNPEVLRDALSELIKRRASGTAANVGADSTAAIKSNANLLFASARQITLGNAQGDVIMVEFFDYNCGFCKRALGDMLVLMKEDPKLKIVLKELPILGPGSVEAARVAAAVRMQDPGGQKYLAFHQKLLGERGPANRETALAAAGSAGLDLARLEKDMTSQEVSETIAESAKLAQALGIRGTPGYVIGNAVIPGAIGAAALKESIKQARLQTGR